jgi:hypothetical protein
MKIINKFIVLIGLIVLLLQFEMQAQQYHPFPEENAFWTVYEFNYNYWDYEILLYTIKGDTVVNDKTYKKIYQLNDLPNSSDTLWTLHNLMRQDIDNKKVYFIRHYQGESTEKLGYDFDVEIGDTVYLPAFDYANIGDSIFEVIDPGFDSTLLNNGEYRRNYFYGSIYPGIDLDPYVIEGVGTQRTPFPNLLYYDAFHQSMLYCLEVEGEHIYGDTSPYPLCGFIVNTNENQQNINITIKSNPCKNYLFITLPDNLNEDAELQLLNPHGIIVYQEKIPFCKKLIKINTSVLPNGIYFLRLSTKSNKYFTRKIIIKH